MKPAVVFIVTFAFTLGFGALFIVIGKAAEPVDAFVTPVPAHHRAPAPLSFRRGPTTP